MHFDHLRHQSITFQKTQHLSHSIQNINQMFHKRCDNTTSEMFYFPFCCWHFGEAKSQVSYSENSNNNPKPKWPRWAFSLQQQIAPFAFCSQLHAVNWPVFSLWLAWKASWDINKNQGCPKTGFQSKALLATPFLRQSWEGTNHLPLAAPSQSLTQLST